MDKQLNSFIDSLSIHTNNLYDHKIVAFERVRYFVNSIFQTSQAQLFGSNAVGLSLPTSDIDIMLFNLPCTCR
jgi:DNA polymerase sigma